MHAALETAHSVTVALCAEIVFALVEESMELSDSRQNGRMYTAWPLAHNGWEAKKDGWCSHRTGSGGRYTRYNWERLSYCQDKFSRDISAKPRYFLRETVYKDPAKNEQESDA
eukprot:SAG31_NODE_5264_length_2644_cov_1.197250_3_plen_113_part_00